MQIRARLALWLAAAMASTVLLFAVSLYLSTRAPSFAQAASFEDIDQRIALQAERASLLIAATRLGEQITMIVDPETGQRRQIASQTLLDLVTDFLIVVNPTGDIIYPAILPDARGLTVEGAAALRQVAEPIAQAERFGTIELGSRGPTVRYVAKPITGTDGVSLGAVVVAAPPGLVQRFTRNIVFAMLILAPLIVISSGLAGYWIAGRSLAPIDAIIDEVRAISDGRSLHKRLAAPPEMDELGRLAATLNAMLARLEQSFGALRRFTADASHELKTPLTVLKSGVERALTTPDTPRESLEVLEETLQEINRMTETVDALLTLARADEGRAPLHLERVDLREQIADVFETAEMLAEPGGLSVVSTTPDRPVIVLADANRIRQLLLNLVTNAIKYTPGDGEVSLGLEEHDETSVLTVSDTGIGIAPGDLTHIFDRFWRGSRARQRTGRTGVGLGLAISKWVAEAHGGSIQVKSRPGRGTTFTVTLPRSQDA